MLEVCRNWYHALKLSSCIWNDDIELHLNGFEGTETRIRSLISWLKIFKDANPTGLALQGSKTALCSWQGIATVLSRLGGLRRLHLALELREVRMSFLTSCLPTLESLELSTSGVVYFDTGAPNLTHLALGYCFPTSGGNKAMALRLKSLCLDHCYFDRQGLPASVMTTSLTRLQLKNFAIFGAWTDIERVWELVHLRELHISFQYGAQGVLPVDGFSKLVALTALILERVDLHLMIRGDGAFSTLTGLEILHLRACRLRCLPDCIMHLPRLDRLDIRGNPDLVSVASWVFDIKTLGIDTHTAIDAANNLNDGAWDERGVEVLMLRFSRESSGTGNNGPGNLLQSLGRARNLRILQLNGSEGASLSLNSIAVLVRLAQSMKATMEFHEDDDF